MDILKRFVLTLRLRKSQYVAVQQCAIFARLIGGEVVRGTAVLGAERCEHYWVQKGDEVFDVPMAYAGYVPDVKLERVIDPVLSDEPVMQRNRELYDLYVNDPKSFWKQTPPFKKMS